MKTQTIPIEFCEIISNRTDGPVFAYWTEDIPISKLKARIAEEEALEQRVGEKWNTSVTLIWRVANV